MGILQCSVVSEPLATLVLSHGDLILASSSGESDYNPRFTVSSAPNSLRLEIRDLQAADSGTYTCTAANFLGNSTSTLDFQANGKLDIDDVGVCGCVCMCLHMGMYVEGSPQKEACFGLFLLGVQGLC